MVNGCCISCGYALAGLPEDGMCPECAFPVRRSLEAAPLLRGADPRWLARVLRGVRALDRSMTWATGIIVLHVLGSLLVLVVSLSASTEGTAGVADVLGVLALKGLGITAFVLAGYGLWLMTTPTPGPHRPPRWARWTARWCGCGLAGLAAVVIVTGVRPVFASAPLAVVLTVKAAVQAAGIAGLLALCRILEHFERSMPDPRSDLPRRVKSTKRNLAGLGVVFLLGWYQTFTMPVAAWHDLGAAAVLLTIGLIVFEPTVRRTRVWMTKELALARPGVGRS